MIKTFKKNTIIILFLIIVLLVSLVGCIKVDKEPATELFFDSYNELEEFINGNNIKILEPNLTETEIFSKYKDIAHTDGILRYYRNYIYADLEDASITDKCYQINTRRDNDVAEEIQGLPWLTFMYKTNIEGLKGIVLELSPVSETKKEYINNVSYPAIKEAIIQLRLSLNKHLKGYEPKKFVSAINEDVDTYYSFINETGPMVYFLYEKGFDRNNNKEYETKIMDFIVNNLKILQV